MFKNAERDPLAIPSRGARHPSMGPTRRVAAPQHDIPNLAGPSGFNPFHPLNHTMPSAGGFDRRNYGTPGAIPSGPNPFEEEQHAPSQGSAPSGPNPFGEYEAPPQKPNPFLANLPRPVAKVLDREARAFMEREGNTDDRSELLYRARRHASTLTSTWSRDASEKVTQAFCGRVAALIPSRPRTAAAQPVTHVADFDDSLLY